MSSLTIYIITAIVSIITALLLVQLTRLSAQAKIKADEKAIRDAYLASHSINEDLNQTIYKEISELTDSEEFCKGISNKVSGILSREIEKRVTQTAQELRKKYESIIEEKSQDKEIAWKKYNKVLAEKKETEAVIHSIAEGLVVVDASGNVVMMNEAAEKLLGVSRIDKIGRPMLEGVKEEQLVSLAKNSPGEDTKEIELVSQENETKKILRASSAVIEDEDGQTVGMVSVLSDITKQRELDRMKSNFVASVSHELRTPLIGIQKSLSLILSKTAGAVSENQEQLLSIADRNLKRLTLLINDLLDLSKLEAGRMDIKREPCSIEKVITESIEGLATWAKSKSLNLEKEIESGLPEVNMDPNRITQVLINLIGNAIKFTPKDGTITVKASSSRGDGHDVQVIVQDTGIGIDKENVSKIFDKFYQVGERTPTDISGTGIGLSIAKEIVILHGGKIWVESERGFGTKFIFTLPLK